MTLPFKSIALAGIALLAGLGIAVAENKPKFGIAIHGGAGTLPRDRMTSELETKYRAGLEQALDAGYRLLEEGASSLDAVTAAVRLLEDNEMFNAGKGAVFTRDGTVELDAAIMDGATLKAGAVAGIKHIRNPVDLARVVMEQSKHVMLIGAGAEEFALQKGMSLVPNSYFYTEHRRAQLQKALSTANNSANDKPQTENIDYFGTVGAVARDKNGDLAAATSTGGITAKLPGRVGDSPIIGAGTYANNNTCAVSGTGQGEFFIRLGVARDIHALMDYRGTQLAAAVDEVVQHRLKEVKAEGGVIAIDYQGNIVMSFNTQGMFRGARDSAGRREVGIY